MRAVFVLCALATQAGCLKAVEREQDSAVLDLGDGDGGGGGAGGGGTAGSDSGSSGGGEDTGDGGGGGGLGGGPGGGDDTGTADEDGDGFSYADGDCDDSDPDVNPWADDDSCDGYDDDCDGSVDEEASVSGDIYEKAGDVWLGDLTDKSGASVDAYLFPDDDIDTYQFYLDEGWFDDFYFEVELIAPAGSDLGMEIYFLPDGGDSFDLIATVDEAGSGGVERYINDGGFWDDNGGYYGILVWANNRGSCEDPYGLSVTVD